MKKIKFIKMNGAGNDFVFIDGLSSRAAVTPSLARKMLDRHFGVGGDQMLVLGRGKNASSYKLSFYNSDGSTAEMCGNGARAAGAYLHGVKGIKKDFSFQTKAGVIGINAIGGRITVNMGRPILEGKKIPTRGAGEIVNRPLKAGGKTFKIHAVSMGNPHCVIYVNDVKNFPVTTYGPLIENHSFFPNRVNVEFVQILSKNRVRARVWERGAGETLACGTGACAIMVAGARVGKTSPSLAIDLPGGQLKATWEKNGNVHLTGPAEISYEGEFYV